jgi:O-antigen ligase
MSTAPYKAPSRLPSLDHTPVFPTIDWDADAFPVVERFPDAERLTPAIETPPPADEPTEHTRRLDDWPHTTRILPWMVAAFIAVLWLVPFNTISMTFSTPVDLKFDRIILPFIFLLWLLAITVGGRAAPRVRVTPIHVGVYVFTALAFVSVVVNGPHLGNALLFSGTLKKLSLLVSYVLLFVIVASSIRRSELKAFMTYTLWLAVICAVGTLYEYHFHVNLFYDWTGRILPSSLFHAQVLNPADSLDAIGRYQVRGPAQLGLEDAAMLGMAFPIALVRILHEPRWRMRIVYILAASVILAATAATFRKTAFLVPAATIVTIGIFRRKEILKLAPIGLIALIGIHGLAPGALGGVAVQFGSSRLAAAATVDHRTAAYDAVRPDVLGHLLLGEGYGAYDETQGYLLDDEVLHRLIEMGALGLMAYVGMIITVIVALRKLIRARAPDRAPMALICACSAAGFLVVSFLFDAMSFPHVPYIFLLFAGFAAILLMPPDEPMSRWVGVTAAHVARRRPAKAATDAAPAARRGLLLRRRLRTAP